MTEYFVLLGASPLQWVFVGELLPPEYKVLAGVATGLMVMSGKYGSYIFKTISVLLFMSVFLTTKMFPLLVVMLGPHGTFWLFGGVAMAANAFYFFFMPETKGKSLLEIQSNFKKSTDSSD